MTPTGQHASWRAGSRLGLAFLLAPVFLHSAAAAKAPAALTAAAEGAVKEVALRHVQALIDAYKACASTPEGDPCAALDALFNYDALVEVPIAKHVNQLTAAQRRRFYAAFGRVVRKAARASGRELTQGQYEVAFHGVSGSTATTAVHIVRPEDDVDTRVGFVWHMRAAGPWQILDVTLDGASMVQDYSNQFGRLLKKDGAEALVAKIEARGKVVPSTQAK